MAWELRHGRKRYFYKTVRVGGAVKKIYLGVGPAAQEQARLDGEKRRRRQVEQAALSGERARVAEADQLTEELRGLASILVEADLLGAGLRRHRGEWRRPRHEREVGDREQRRPEGPTGRAEGG